MALAPRHQNTPGMRASNGKAPGNEELAPIPRSSAKICKAVSAGKSGPPGPRVVAACSARASLFWIRRVSLFLDFHLLSPGTPLQAWIETVAEACLHETGRLTSH